MAGFALVLCACGTDVDADARGSASGGEAPLAAEIVYEGDSLEMPHLLAIAGEHLLVSDAGGGPSLHVLRQGRWLASCGRRGGGPGEFSSIRTLQPTDDGEQVWLYDPGNRRLTRLDLGAVLAGTPGAVRETTLLRSELLPMNSVRFSDSLIVTSGLFTRGRLGLFTGTGEPRGVVGALPPGRNGVPAPIVQHAYTGTLARHPRRPLVALATRHADRVELYGTDGTLHAVGRSGARFEPVYEVQARGGVPFMASGEDLRFGYVDIAAAGERLYALFSGHTRRERPGRANFGQQVHVFDWTGRLLRVVELDQPVIGIAVHEDERMIYAVRHDPEPAVLRYALPADLR